MSSKIYKIFASFDSTVQFWFSDIDFCDILRFSGYFEKYNF